MLAQSFVVFIYLILGAVIFRFVEHQHNEDTREDIAKYTKEFMGKSVLPSLQVFIHFKLKAHLHITILCILKLYIENTNCR